jgi:nicotinate-nucleotide adenylyltransferase
VKKKTGLRVGLLGGSFNPAHDGHKIISLEAIKRLKLDYVIWLVAPQNPLKSLKIYDTFDQRFNYATKFADHPKIKVSDLEKKIGSCYTFNTIDRLKSMHRDTKFVWLMGADNLANFHKWKHWKRIIEMCPIAIFDRDNFSKLILYSQLTLSYKNGRVRKNYIGELKSNSWHYFMMKKNSISSTGIRNSLNKELNKKQRV